MKKILIYIILVLIVKTSLATHNRAGNITYEYISGFTYKITLVTFTSFAPGVVADRPELEIHFGDNTSQWVQRFPPEDDTANYIRTNTYVTTHTYPGTGTYEIFMEDPNRNDGVENIPNSVSIPFSIRSTLIISSVLGHNNSPILLNPAIDFYAVNKFFRYNPGAYDPDGDSLSYKLVPCTGENGQAIESYSLPTASDTIYIDAITGEFVWNVPIVAGIFNIAILIEEYRYGYKNGSIVRDIQFETKETDNDPPEIFSIDKACVKATDTLTFDVSATDANDDEITLSALGGPFVEDFPATFPVVAHVSEVESLFSWETKCSHVRKQPYMVLLRAKDNNPDLSLVGNKDVYIYVIAPEIENLELFPTNNSIEIVWSKTKCTEAKGYKIYRKLSSAGFVPDECEYGVPDLLEFDLIASIEDLDDTVFTDNNDGIGLNQGFNYCYHITTFYDDGAESYASEEVCSPLIKGIPTITNVSIYDKITESDSVYIAWSKPTEFDTIQYPGPYKYYIYRSNDLWGKNMTLLDSLYLNGLNDTIYYDRSGDLDFRENPYSYKVELYNETPGREFIIDNPMIVSTIDLQIFSGDNKLTLKPVKNTPWIDSVFVVYKRNPATFEFDSIGFTENQEFVDSGLINGDRYYYYLVGISHYTEPRFVYPLINNSQKIYGVPIDTVPPCPPRFTFESICNEYTNKISWEYPDCGDDVVKYHIYYSPNFYSDPVLIDSVLDASQFTYLHQPDLTMAGCYYVTAVDSFENESNNYKKICIDSCTYYELPNMFSPNGDNKNELFIPITPSEVYSKFVDKIKLQIYNRWGQPVSDVITDPEINWDGKDVNSKKLLPDGVYYYTCEVYEYHLLGLDSRTIVGFIHLFGQPFESSE